ncbi:GNAT family N-acetyltransferase [Streptomyces sp. DSM 42041]|uniref:GNAT family N-acetyltransferase n=1 Tax=Streptomyces hazeniae TaxID=3075538 RepID=A0ABU2NNH1_9ACTN|nr:GNAT family N-acetyltransferase [Streptomyces sp. DSM 42041]MDT0378007.1 GNAT family N-acetyltransferase [Streptomyces sp. DSM 42041]
MTSLRLERLTPQNVEAAMELKVRPEQERYVDPVAHSLAEAYVWPGVAWPRLVFDGEEPVAFLMAFLDIRFTERDPEGVLRSGLWRLNVAAGSQGRGVGRFAVEAVCAEIRRRGGTQAYVTWKPGAGGPEAFYLRLGFRPTGETSGGETVGVLEL